MTSHTVTIFRASLRRIGELGQYVDLAMDVGLINYYVRRDFRTAWKHKMSVTMKSVFVSLMSLTSMMFRSSSFWNVAPRRWVTGNRRFEISCWSSSSVTQRLADTCSKTDILPATQRKPTNSDLSAHLNNIRYNIFIYSPFAMWIFSILELQIEWGSCTSSRDR